MEESEMEWSTALRNPVVVMVEVEVEVEVEVGACETLWVVAVRSS